MKTRSLLFAVTKASNWGWTSTDTITLAGVDDSTMSEDVPRAVANRDPRLPVVLLAVEGRFDDAWRRSVSEKGGGPGDRLLRALYGDGGTPQPEWDSLVSNRALRDVRSRELAVQLRVVRARQCVS